MRMKKAKISWVSCWVALFMLLYVVPTVAADSPSVVEVTGRVTLPSGQAVADAVVKAVGSDVSAVLTDVDGKYKFYLVGQREFFTLRIYKEGYTVKSSKPMDPSIPEGKVTFDGIIELTGQQKMKVEMSDFISGVSISGKVTGVGADDTGRYKVLVYVLTDKWYIHPYAENKDGRGYASIASDGSWTIQTTNRGHNPFKLAMLVVPADYMPPLQIPVSEDTDQSLLAKIGKQLAAFRIIAAPKGL